jgi:hypothetical protein
MNTDTDEYPSEKHLITGNKKTGVQLSRHGQEIPGF